MRFEPSDDFDPDSADLYPGTSSTVLKSRDVSKALAARDHDGSSDDPFRAAIGIVNGALLGAGFWLSLYFVYRLMSL